ncbi:hypothetical protein ACWD6P_22495 [Streptomyces sp. NPDC002446]
MGFLYDADVATMERFLNRVLYAAFGTLLMPPLLIALAIFHQQWHLALLVPVLLPFLTAYLALRAKREIRMGLCYGAGVLLVITVVAVAAALGCVQG